VSRGARLAVWAAVGALLLAYSAPRIEFSTDITNFLPDGRGAELASLSRQLARSDLARTMVLCVGAEDPARAVTAAKALADTLRANPEVEWLRSGADQDFLRHVYELYFPRRAYFLSDQPASELPARLGDESLERQARALRSSLSLPISPLLKRVAPEDPLGAFQGLSDRLRAGEPPLAQRDGVFTTPDGRWAVILLATKHSAFDSTAQKPLLDAIEARFQGLRAAGGGDLVLEKSGANRFAVDAEQKIRGDASMISTLSGIGVAALSLLFFRSLFSLGVVTVPGLAGLVVALALGLAVFGHMDGMTLAFGASLIGVTIDYPTHVLILWSLSDGSETPWQLTRRIGGSLVMAALTTMASFAGLALTSFRGFRELGVFSVLGVAGALVTTLFMLPDLLPRKRRIQPVSAGLARRFTPWLASLRARRGTLAVALLALLALGAFALPKLRWNDDLSHISAPDPVLQAEDERVRERVSHFDSGRFVIALGDDADAALRRNEKVYDRLEALVADGKLDGVRSLHALLWPEELQRENLDALRASPNLPERLDAAFTRAGFRPGSFAPWSNYLAAPPPPLTLADLRASELGPLVSSLVFELGERTAVITYLRGLRDSAALEAALSDMPDVFFFEQRTFLNAIYARFRDQTLRLIALGSVAVFGLLLAHYRNARHAAAAFLPSLLVPIIVLSLLALFGVQANLLHAVSLLLVMGMGVDYGIFIVDSALHEEEIGPTLVSCLLCCLTTILSFGTLALSSQPPLRAIGVTTGVGITFALVLAPFSLLLLRVGPNEARDA
jgi:predicted exporter